VKDSRVFIKITGLTYFAEVIICNKIADGITRCVITVSLALLEILEGHFSRRILTLLHFKKPFYGTFTSGNLRELLKKLKFALFWDIAQRKTLIQYREMTNKYSRR
jgi:hypothetical protein